MPGAITLKFPQGLGAAILLMEKMAAQPESTSPKWRWPCPWTPATEVPSRNALPTKNHCIVSDILCSVELGGNQTQSNSPERPVHVMGVQGSVHLISSSMTGRCLWAIRLSGIWASPRIEPSKVKGGSSYLHRGGILDCQPERQFCARYVPEIWLMPCEDFPRSGDEGLCFAALARDPESVPSPVSCLWASASTLLPETSAEDSAWAKLSPEGLNTKTLLESREDREDFFPQ